ncbi:MAG: SIMPL domain-containing protein [Patescibacteria group bacterium]
MNNELKNLAKVFLLFLFVIAVFWYVSAYSRSVVPERVFTVSGEGKVVTVPDVAEVSFGVLTEGGKNLTDLQKQNTEKINRIVSYLKEEGIDQKDIKTQYYNISPRYQYFSCPPGPLPLRLEAYLELRPCPPSEIIGYSINQSVLVKVRDLNKAGDILSGVVERGANTVSGPNFTIDDPDALQNEAREKAIKKAKEKAKSLARAGGFRVGKLVSISEGFSGPIPLRFETLSKDGTGGGPSIEPGSQEVIINVTLTYEIR